MNKVLDDFSYLRIEGLSTLLDILKTFNDEDLAIFLALQDIPEINCKFFYFLPNRVT